MKRDKYSVKIRIAIVVTILLIAPTALGIGVYLKDSLTNNIADTEKVTRSEIQITEEDSKE